MTGGELLALAERLEALSGPDREVDARIWCTLRGLKYKGWHDVYGRDSGRLTQVVFTAPPRRTEMVSDGRSKPHALPFTASIDAAITLVPEGWRLANLGETVIEGIDPWNSRVLEKRFDGRAGRAEGDAATAALALTAAALRARALATPINTVSEGEG